MFPVPPATGTGVFIHAALQAANVGQGRPLNAATGFCFFFCCFFCCSLATGYGLPATAFLFRLPAPASPNAPKCPKNSFYPPLDHLRNLFACNNLRLAANPFSEILWAIVYLTYLAQSRVGG